MKGIRLLFIACLAPLLFGTAVADGAQKSSRTQNRRTTTGTASTRERTNVTSRASAASTVSRATMNQPVRARTNIVSRDTQTRAKTPQRSITSRTATTSTQLGGRPNPRSTTTARTTTRTTGTKSANRGRSATTTTTATPTITREDIISRDTSKCRTVFYECMDEFCANKDAQLKRCACSTRINEFQGIKENLEQVEDKLLDFSQRLLTVNMDAEDAAVLNQATEGELAFSQADTSQSKKMLDEIAKKLNTSFDNSNFDQSLNAISLSLDMDSAFDTIDSMAGASTTTKSGTALYSAALPVCREMALEVCSADELSIAEGGYQMLIEQDCNTVKKSYQTQSDQARSKVFESSALLDMSRLDIHQQRNSDDILTCKSKMLDMLTNSTVCGTDMEKCLDMTGRYIDPSTGTAILSTNLANLKTLIKRPTSDNETWSNIAQNARYISFLNTKKQFLEPAMENCQDISKTVWNQFVEDALAQIKLSQEKKLEEIRQSCTTLLSQCLDSAAENIQDFDERALSMFGVAADKTAKAMCADIKTSCTALFDATDANSGTTGGGESGTTNDWESGVTEITNTKSYETILSTCREIGRNCIIQACRSIEGNFTLCENIDTSINRKAIINRTACWNEVSECVAQAGEKTIEQIMIQQGRNKKDGHIYSTLYTASTPTYDGEKIIDDICSSECNDDVNHKCRTCRLAEQIWGNCEHTPTYDISAAGKTNKIYVMSANSESETLLSWFARNTGTASDSGSCRDTSCPAGFSQNVETQQCISSENFTTDRYACIGLADKYDAKKLTISANITNCCFSSSTNTENLPSTPATPINTDFWHSGFKTSNYCCQHSTRITNIQQLSNLTALFNNACLQEDSNNDCPQNFYNISNVDRNSGIGGFCGDKGTSPNAVAEVTLSLTDSATATTTTKTFALICMGDVSGADEQDSFPSGQTLNCNGKYVLVSTEGWVLDPFTVFNDSATPIVESYYYRDSAETPNTNKCVLKGTGNNTIAWVSETAPEQDSKTCNAPTSGWQVNYPATTATTTQSTYNN